MQVTEAEYMGVIDDNRIGIRNIQTSFDNCRCNQHIKVMINKFEHYIFQFIPLELPMSNTNACSGSELAN
ncbi:hypothetical protein D3C73_1034040 [compost metagenome]